MKRNFRALHDYEENPPRCQNCTFLLQRAKGNEKSQAHGPYCNKGHFEVKLSAVCDAWESRRGETLEKKQNDH